MQQGLSDEPRDPGEQDVLAVESFGYRWDEVHDDAEVLEHAVSDRLLEAISESLGDPVRDPHGDPIPAPDGTVVQPVGILLERAPIPFTGAVVRISDRDSALLQFLDGRGIRLDTMVDVVERRPFGGALVIRADGVETDLGAQAASSVWLSA